MHTIRSCRKMPLFALLVVSIFGCAALIAADDPEPIRSFKPYVSWSGAHSDIDTRSYERITNVEDWKELWQRHRGDRIDMGLSGWPSVPEIDFDNCMVVCVFRGDGQQCNGEFVVAIDEFDDRIRLRYDSYTFQIAVMNDEPIPDYSGTPYGLFVIPRSDKQVYIEENTQGLIGRPSIWTPRHRFARMVGG